MPRYRILAHTADIGIAASGATPVEAFENAAFGMFDLMFDLSAAAGDEEECPIEARGDDLAELLVAWLSALLAEAEIRDLVFRRFRIQTLGAGWLLGSAAGVPSGPLDLRGPPVKAVTYHDLAVEEASGGWEARVIFDV